MISSSGKVPSPRSSTEVSSIQKNRPKYREALEKSLARRRPIKELVNQGILLNPLISNPVKVIELQRAKTADSLKRKIERRPDKQVLINRRILTDNKTNASPYILEKCNALEKNQLCESLNSKLNQRPGSLELIEKGVLKVDNGLANLIKLGSIPYTRVGSTTFSETSHKPPNFTGCTPSSKPSVPVTIGDVNLPSSNVSIKTVSSKNYTRAPSRSLKDETVICRYGSLVFHNYRPNSTALTGSSTSSTVTSEFQKQRAREAQQAELLNLQNTAQTRQKLAQEICQLKEKRPIASKQDKSQHRNTPLSNSVVLNNQQLPEFQIIPSLQPSGTMIFQHPSNVYQTNIISSSENNFVQANMYHTNFISSEATSNTSSMHQVTLSNAQLVDLQLTGYSSKNAYFPNCNSQREIQHATTISTITIPVSLPLLSTPHTIQIPSYTPGVINSETDLDLRQPAQCSSSNTFYQLPTNSLNISSCNPGNIAVECVFPQSTQFSELMNPPKTAQNIYIPEYNSAQILVSEQVSRPIFKTVNSNEMPLTSHTPSLHQIEKLMGQIRQLNQLIATKKQTIEEVDVPSEVNQELVRLNEKQASLCVLARLLILERLDILQLQKPSQNDCPSENDKSDLELESNLLQTYILRLGGTYQTLATKHTTTCSLENLDSQQLPCDLQPLNSSLYSSFQKVTNGYQLAETFDKNFKSKMYQLSNSSLSPLSMKHQSIHNQSIKKLNELQVSNSTESCREAMRSNDLNGASYLNVQCETEKKSDQFIQFIDSEKSIKEPNIECFEDEYLIDSSVYLNTPIDVSPNQYALPAKTTEGLSPLNLNDEQLLDSKLHHLSAPLDSYNSSSLFVKEPPQDLFSSFSFEQQTKMCEDLMANCNLPTSSPLPKNYDQLISYLPVKFDATMLNNCSNYMHSESPTLLHLHQQEHQPFQHHKVSASHISHTGIALSPIDSLMDFS